MSALRLKSSKAMQEALRALLPLYERKSGRQVAADFIGGVELVKRMKAGEAADVVVLHASAIDELIAHGALARGRTDFVRSGIGAGVRAGAKRPDMGSAEALTRSLLAARSIAVSSGPSGVYLVGLFERLGVPKEKILQTAPGVPAAALVASGEAEIGFQQVSEILGVAGVDFAGPLPEAVQHITVFSGGLHQASSEPQAARGLIDFLASREAAAIVKQQGMEPIQ